MKIYNKCRYLIGGEQDTFLSADVRLYCFTSFPDFFGVSWYMRSSNVLFWANCTSLSVCCGQYIISYDLSLNFSDSIELFDVPSNS